MNWPGTLISRGPQYLRPRQQAMFRGAIIMIGKVNTPAVPFELQDTKGVVHTLDQYAGRWLLLVFHRHLG